MIPAIPLLPAAVVGLGILAYMRSGKKEEKPAMNPQQTTVFETAMNSVQDPAKLSALANAFREAGLTREAEMLEKRAQLRNLPPDVKEGRAQVFRDAMASENPEAVMRVADSFEKEGALGAATALRAYATQLSLAQKATKIA